MSSTWDAVQFETTDEVFRNSWLLCFPSIEKPMMHRLLKLNIFEVGMSDGKWTKSINLTKQLFSINGHCCGLHSEVIPYVRHEPDLRMTVLKGMRMTWHVHDLFKTIGKHCQGIHQCCDWCKLSIESRQNQDTVPRLKRDQLPHLPLSSLIHFHMNKTNNKW